MAAFPSNWDFPAVTEVDDGARRSRVPPIGQFTLVVRKGGKPLRIGRMQRTRWPE